jgi:hypothetical protein
MLNVLVHAVPFFCCAFRSPFFWSAKNSVCFDLALSLCIPCVCCRLSCRHHRSGLIFGIVPTVMIVCSFHVPDRVSYLFGIHAPDWLSVNRSFPRTYDLDQCPFVIGFRHGKRSERSTGCMTQTQVNGTALGGSLWCRSSFTHRVRKRSLDGRQLPAADASEKIELSVSAMMAWIPCSSNDLSIALSTISLRTDRARSTFSAAVISTGDEAKRSWPGHSV